MEALSDFISSVVEFLVGGILFTLALSYFLLGIPGVPHIDTDAAGVLRLSSPVLLIIFIGIIYALGVVAESAARAVFEVVLDRLTVRKREFLANIVTAEEATRLLESLDLNSQAYLQTQQIAEIKDRLQNELFADPEDFKTIAIIKYNDDPEAVRINLDKLSAEKVNFDARINELEAQIALKPPMASGDSGCLARDGISGRSEDESNRGDLEKELSKAKEKSMMLGQELSATNQAMLIIREEQRLKVSGAKKFRIRLTELLLGDHYTVEQRDAARSERESQRARVMTFHPSLHDEVQGQLKRLRLERVFALSMGVFTVALAIRGSIGWSIVGLVTTVGLCWLVKTRLARYCGAIARAYKLIDRDNLRQVAPPEQSG